MAIVKINGFSYLSTLASAYPDSLINQEMAFDGYGEVMKAVSSAFSVDNSRRNHLTLTPGSTSAIKGWMIDLLNILPDNPDVIMVLGMRINGWNGTVAAQYTGAVGMIFPSGVAAQQSFRQAFTPYAFQVGDYVEFIYNRKAKTLTRDVNAGTSRVSLSLTDPALDRYFAIGTFSSSIRIEFRDFYATITTDGTTEQIGPCSVVRASPPTIISAGGTKSVPTGNVPTTTSSVVGSGRVDAGGNGSGSLPTSLALDPDPLVISVPKPEGDVRILASRVVTRSMRGDPTLPSQVELKVIDSTNGAVISTVVADTTATVSNGRAYSPVIPSTVQRPFDKLIFSLGAK